MAKDPLDMVLYPILFHEIAPRTVIELGAYTGASAMWMADTLATAGIESRVISVDIDLSLVEEMAKKRGDIEFLEGTATGSRSLSARHAPGVCRIRWSSSMTPM